MDRTGLANVFNSNAYFSGSAVTLTLGQRTVICECISRSVQLRAHDATKLTFFFYYILYVYEKLITEFALIPVKIFKLDARNVQSNETHEILHSFVFEGLVRINFYPLIGIGCPFALIEFDELWSGCRR